MRRTALGIAAAALIGTVSAADISRAAPSQTVCSAPPPLMTGTCEVAGSGADTLLVGTVLAPDRIYRGGGVRFDAQGVITCVGCGCTGAGATTVNCPEAVITPGLINPHDHIRNTHNSPVLDTGERYEHRHEWRLGLNGHTMIAVAGSATDDEVRWGELRHLLSGTTSIVGAFSQPGLVRNLDWAPNQEGLGQGQVDSDTFPLGDFASETLLTSGCAYPDIFTEGELALEEAYVAHVAEGIDAAARNEFRCLNGAAEDLVEPQSAFVHLVGMSGADYDALAPEQTELLWSPRSNIFLYGDTARVTTAALRGATIALGTDWTATGSMNLLRELRCADAFNEVYLDRFFSDEELWQMVTLNPAISTGTEDAIGTLEAGQVADVAVFDASALPLRRDRSGPDDAADSSGGHLSPLLL